MKPKQPHGFVTGTLVHTDKGLVPIEQLKVGDLVLSKPESGEGEVAYKRVMKTFKSPEKHPIMRIAYRKLLEVEPENVHEFLPHAKEKDWSDDLYIYCTVNHPFWTKENGWVNAENLFSDDRTRDVDYTLLDYRGAELFAVSQITYATPLIETIVSDVAIQKDWHTKHCQPNEIYNVIDFRSGSPVILTNFPEMISRNNSIYDVSWDRSQPHIDINKNYNHPALKDFMLSKKSIDDRGFFIEEKDESYYKATVYNLEIENCHTYFTSLIHGCQRRQHRFLCFDITDLLHMQPQNPPQFQHRFGGFLDTMTAFDHLLRHRTVQMTAAIRHDTIA
jgi:hypothetical protein